MTAAEDSTPARDARGVVYESAGGVYTVVLADGTSVEASLRGRLKKDARAGSSVVIGDHVALETRGGAWTIESVAPRETELARRSRAGRAPKVLAANLDRVLAVAALGEPRASTELIDRLLVLVEASGMRPVLVLNKLDLEGAADRAAELTRLYEPIGYRVLPTSALRGDGLDTLTDLLCRGSSALIGPSGVGKSSLLNAVEPGLELVTATLSRKTGTGRHTTVGSRLIRMQCGGCVADTPGFSDVSLWSVRPEDVSTCFPEFAEPSGECRFRGCTHLHEPDCGVQAARVRGDIADSRYRSYAALHEEASDGSGTRGARG